MSEANDFVTIRRLPDGSLQSARIAKRLAGRLSLETLDHRVDPPDKTNELTAGALVEIDAPEAMYLGQVIGTQPDSLVTVTVEHVIERSALAGIEKVWKTAERA